MMQPTQWKPNVILVDADYLDGVVFDLSVNFERMLERRIPPADLPLWLDCIALDGGLRPGPNEVQVLFVHSAGKTAMNNMQPGDFTQALDGRAFSDNLGEFCLSSMAVEAVTTRADFVGECFDTLCDTAQVQTIMTVADMNLCGGHLLRTCSRLAHGKKDITLFGMQPLSGRGFQQEMLGYSLMRALGVGSEELDKLQAPQ